MMQTRTRGFGIYCKSALAFILLSGYLLTTIDATQQTLTQKMDNLTFSATWDDEACQGSTVEITYNIASTGTQTNTNYSFEGFVPQVAGVCAASVLFQPAPGSYTSFSGTAVPPGVILDGCPSCSNNRGVWTLSQPFPMIVNGYNMVVSLTLTQCGIFTFAPCIAFVETTLGTQFSIRQCFGTITFDVVPNATLMNQATGPICQGSIVTGQLPPPICTAQQGFTCPNCIPCNACSGFTGTTGATACTACSGVSGCLCPCTACDNYTGCPACTSCNACSGCVACTGFTGPCGPYPFHYTVTDGTGGVVILLDPTGGVYQFTPNSSFFGTASFFYNVQSDFQPIIFCPAVTAGEVDIGYAQNPIASNESISVCASGNITGNLAPLVTGGSGNYTFSGPIGGLSCTGGNVTITPSGIFNFTAPTGLVTPCSFVYQATDNTPPNCLGTGLVSVTINPIPIANDQSISVCENSSISGTLTAAGGSGIYTNFVITTPATNGTATITDPVAGTFTYTPNFNFSGSDSFQFNVTDSNGCISLVPGTVSINVNPLPVLSSTSVTGCENTPFTGTLVPLVTGGAPPFIFSATGPAPSCGGVAISSNGDYLFAPNTDFVGSCSFQFTVSASGCSATAPGTVTVNIALAPIATGGSTGICASGTVIGNLNDFVISAPPVVSFTGGPGVNGTLNLNTVSGGFTFTPSISSGLASFPFQVLSSGLPCPSDVENLW